MIKRLKIAHVVYTRFCHEDPKKVPAFDFFMTKTLLSNNSWNDDIWETDDSLLPTEMLCIGASPSALNPQQSKSELALKSDSEYIRYHIDIVEKNPSTSDSLPYTRYVLK